MKNTRLNSNSMSVHRVREEVEDIRQDSNIRITNLIIRSFLAKVATGSSNKILNRTFSSIWARMLSKGFHRAAALKFLILTSILTSMGFSKTFLKLLGTFQD